MPVVTWGRGRRGKTGLREKIGVHSILLGALGALLRLYGVAAIAVLVDLPSLIADALRTLADSIAGGGGLSALTGLAAALALPLARMGILGVLIVISGVGAWLLGGKLLDRGWKAITSRWSRRARYALLFFNILGTALWILGLIALAYPFVSAYLRGVLGSAESYLETLVSTARVVHVALIAFALSALTPAVAGAIHATQSWGKKGRLAALLLSLGGLIYGVNAIVVYVAWRRFAADVLAHLPASNIAALMTPSLAAMILRGLADIASMFSIYLRIAMITYVLWFIGFIAAWWDYWRASRGM